MSLPRALCLTLALLLGGCASRELPFHAPQEAVPVDAPFNLSGRLSVKAAGKGQLARFEWTHAPARDELSVNTPLGTTVARVTRDAEGVLLLADGKSWHAADVETLTEQVLGWPLPLANLAWWVRGRAAPGVPHEFLADGALLQQGWTIRFVSDEPGAAYPQRIDLVRDDISLRVVASEWRTPSIHLPAILP
ncbi:outer membrane lipoprotein LolB [Craterilacuibacter sp. RT1T]|uniref:outer membrane lipoprotein LolB n=1 Tax=Craterilacuibacter sp. RT1T TaxID=2942211 RepID=UPI0020BF8FCE|nr:outer membrane lipoprotein LolB [Craterilacuibacter sp. RT1T]MCL6264251.1 outer membrane lipoprotein LolB [Craterilacuibacter sp. RT1T]